MDLLVLFSFLKALRASPLMRLWGLTSYQLHLTFCFPLSSDFKPGEVLGSIPRTALASFTGKCYEKLQAPASSVLVWMLVLPLQDSFSQCFAPVFQPSHVSMLFSILVARAAG